jgi:molybdopterin converting factor small subunit
MPKVKLKVSYSLRQSLGDETTDTEEILVSALEGESVLTLLRRLAAENGLFWKSLFDEEHQAIHPGVLLILNNRIINPYDRSEATLKEGDELTLLPMMDGG